MTVDKLKTAVANINAYLSESHYDDDTVTLTINVIRSVKENYEELIKYKEDEISLEKSRWISVDERLPECETEVFVLAVSSYGNKTVTTAMYEDGKRPEDESAWSWEDVEMDYNEETDQYIIPCGWWEYRYYGECLNFAVDDKVTHWMPLPEPPKEGVKNEC